MADRLSGKFALADEHGSEEVGSKPREMMPRIKAGAPVDNAKAQVASGSIRSGGLRGP